MRKLKELREKAGMSQEELAAKCGVLQNVISRIERGYYHKGHKKCQYYCGEKMQQKIMAIFPQLTKDDFKVKSIHLNHKGKVGKDDKKLFLKG